MLRTSPAVCLHTALPITAAAATNGTAMLHSAAHSQRDQSVRSLLRASARARLPTRRKAASQRCAQRASACCIGACGRQRWPQAPLLAAPSRLADTIARRRFEITYISPCRLMPAHVRVLCIMYRSRRTYRETCRCPVCVARANARTHARESLVRSTNTRARRSARARARMWNRKFVLTSNASLFQRTAVLRSLFKYQHVRHSSTLSGSRAAHKLLNLQQQQTNKIDG